MKKRGEIVASAPLYESTRAPPKKEANPASLRSAAPSKGRGSRGHSLLPMEGGAPKGRRLDGDSGVKKSEEMHLKSTINESTRAPPKKEANPASLRSAAPSKGRDSRGHILLPMEGGAPKGRRLDGGSGMKKSGEDRLKCVVYESTLSTAGAVPLPQWGRLRYDDAAFLASSKRIQDTWRKRITTDKAFPAWGRWRAKRVG